MDLNQCWSYYQKAEKLVNQGHWPEAHYLFEQVLAYLPQHLHYAAQSTQTKPCQLVCLISGLRDCAVYQSEILNTMGQQQGAYQVLNQSYALLQFLSIENSPLVRTVASVLDSNSHDLLEHINAFCHAQRAASWQLEYANIEKVHRYFTQLKHQQGQSTSATRLN